MATEKTEYKLWLLIFVAACFVFALLRYYQLTPIRQMTYFAVSVFHDRLNDGQYGQIYQDSTNEFRHIYSEEAFIGLLTNLRQDIGRVRESNIYKWGYSNDPSGNAVRLISTTNFCCTNGKSKTIHESFEYKIIGNKAVMLNYSNDYNSELFRKAPN